MIEIVEHCFKHSGIFEYRKKTDKIIIHCTATPEGRDFSVDDIDMWHKKRHFSCIGYHFVIYRDGSIHRGRPMGTVGAHCQGHNSSSVSVCYIGGCDGGGKIAKDTRTVAQKTSLINTVKWLLTYYGLSISEVYGHCDFAAKACPSFDVKSFHDLLLFEN